MKRFVALAWACLAPATSLADISTTRHNLSVTGPGPIRSPTETEICVFCHVPHGAPPMLGPGTNYVPYNSTTLASSPPGQPNGATKLCLSCHDGTIALGQRFAGFLPIQDRANLGSDLRSSHPVSFVPAASPELRSPARGDPVRLDTWGRVQCTSCHDPHEDRRDPIAGKFLVKSNDRSAICTTCHAKAWWDSNPSSHQSSEEPFDATRGAHTAYGTVARNGCESCHRPHAATTASLLLKTPQPQVCLTCHDGVVASDIRTDVSKAYAHPVLTTSPDLHDASEGPSSDIYPIPETSAVRPRHAQCTDCHEPHAARAAAPGEPASNGPLSGVWGIDRNGVRVHPVRFEYEVCFKCHSSSANQPQRFGPTPPQTVRRAVIDVNLRNRFDVNAPSFHPVVGPGRNSFVPGLLLGLTETSVITCSDCHASDTTGRGRPRGPHGSTQPHILERHFSTADPTVESPEAYALCYKCHDRGVLLSTQSGFRHASHVGTYGAPCSVCHDWHGVSALQGNASNNAHLIDFDVSVVTVNARGARSYQAGGPRTGACSLRCHGAEHDGRSY